MANQDHGECDQATCMTGDYHGLQPLSSPAYPGDSSIHHLEEKVQDSGIYRNGVCTKKDCYNVGGFRGMSFCRECYEKFKQELFRSDRAHRENSQVNMPSSIPSVSAAGWQREDTPTRFTKPNSARSGVVSPPPSYSTLPTHNHPSPHTAPHTGSRWQEPVRSLPAASPYQDYYREPVRGQHVSAPPITGDVSPTSAQPIRTKRIGERRGVKGGGDKSRLHSSAGGTQDRAGSRAPSHVQSQATGDIGQDQLSAAYQGYPAEDPGKRNPCLNLYCSNFADSDCGGFCVSCFWAQHQGRETGRSTSAGWMPVNTPRHLPTTNHRQDNISVTSDPNTPVHVDVHDNQFTFNTYIHPSAFTPSMWVPNSGVIPHVVKSSIPAIQGPLTEPLVRFPSFGESEFETGGERVFSGREKELLSWNTSAMGREDYV